MPRARSSSARPGAIVVGGRYRLVELIAQGGMGEVWRAQHVSLRSAAAVKVIAPEVLADATKLGREQLLDRFEREAQVAAGLQSAHIVRVLDHSVEGGIPYLAMELLEGEVLAQRLERVGRLTPAETLPIMVQVARALGHAHRSGVVHRDLKPENVFITTEDGVDLVKILDFGIAKLARSPLDGRSRTTRTGQLIGTPSFMSPEQIQGHKDVDARADLWAMAVMVFECLCGCLPFEGRNVGDLVLQICTRPPPVPSEVAAVPDGFDTWWQTAIARDPDARFASASELIAALTLVLENAPAPPVAERGPRATERTLRSKDAEPPPMRRSVRPSARPTARPSVRPSRRPSVRPPGRHVTGPGVSARIDAPPPKRRRWALALAVPLIAAAAALLAFGGARSTAAVEIAAAAERAPAPLLARAAPPPAPPPPVSAPSPASEIEPGTLGEPAPPAPSLRPLPRLLPRPAVRPSVDPRLGL